MLGGNCKSKKVKYSA